MIHDSKLETDARNVQTRAKVDDFLEPVRYERVKSTVFMRGTADYRPPVERNLVFHRVRRHYIGDY